MSASNEQLRQSIEQYVADRKAWLQEGLEILGLDVYPEPTEVRADGEDLGLSADQEIAFREVAGRFGLGGEVDVVSGARHQIIEGGKPWKIEAEAAIADKAETVIYAGSPHRIIGQDERDYLTTKYGAELPDQVSEYYAAVMIATNQKDFVISESSVLPFGYDIDNGHTLVQEQTGQLVQMGTQNGRPVLALRVDREDYEDEEGNKKYRNQPDSAALMGFIADVLSATGDDVSSVGLNTSNTYASRAIDAVRAGLSRGRVFEVGMYGRETLAEIQGKPATEPTAINQIPGELHAMSAKLSALQAEL